MQYMGGKHRIAKQIAEAIAELRNGRPYLEPFVGGGHVLERVEQGSGRWAGDANVALVNLYRAVLAGWQPPEELSREEWARLKEENDAEDPLTAFAGIGCSFMGMWFSSYAPNKAGVIHRALLRQRPLFEGTTFLARSYEQWIPVDSMIYCDPPYSGTTGYAAVGPFDHRHYWLTLQGWARLGNTVLASEYVAPAGVARCIAEFEVKGKMKAGGKAVERLFLVEA